MHFPPPSAFGSTPARIRLAPHPSPNPRHPQHACVPPVLVDAAGEGDLFVDLGAGGHGEGDLGEVALDGDDAAARGGRPDVDHEDLALGQLLHLGLLGVLGLDTEQAAEQKVVDLDLDEDRRQRADGAEHLPDQAVRAAQRRVDLGADT